MAVAERAADDPGLVTLIAEETDRTAIRRIRQHAISADAQRVWVQLLSRRIADLTRSAAPTDFTRLIKVLDERHERSN